MIAKGEIGEFIGQTKLKCFYFGVPVLPIFPTLCTTNIVIARMKHINKYIRDVDQKTRLGSTVQCTVQLKESWLRKEALSHVSTQFVLFQY